MAVGQRPGSDRPRRRPEGAELLERQPPCNLEAERAVLGSVLLKPDVCDDVVLIIRPEDFYDEGHQKLFAHMLALHEEGRKVDLTLLVDRLKTSGDLEMIGGYAALAEIGNSVPTAANAQFYAGIVREKSPTGRSSTSARRSFTTPTTRPTIRTNCWPRPSRRSSPFSRTEGSASRPTCRTYSAT